VTAPTLSLGAPRGPARAEAAPRAAGREAPSAAECRPGHFFVAGEAGTWHAVASASVHMGYRGGAAARVASGPALCGDRPAGPWGDVGGRPFGPLCCACAARLRLESSPAGAPVAPRGRGPATAQRLPAAWSRPR
jgi:hypothetical protein